MALSDAWDELRQRGIAETAKAAGWLPEGDYWEYPIRNLDDVEVCNRQKRRQYNGTGQKYLWPQGKHEQATYYHPSRLRENIAAAGGLLYIAAGEPDVLVLASAGLRNVLSWFGEGSLPPTLLEDLKALGVKSVVYLPDCDSAGYSAAWKVYQMLDHTGIGLRMVQWGGKFGDGYDANREWIECKFSAEAFATALKTARDPETFFLDAQLNTDWRPPQETAPAEPPAHFDGELPAELIADIEARLGVAGERVTKEGWTVKRVACLEMAHSKDDKAPSASWNNRTYCLKCHKCNTTMNAKAVAAALGLGWSTYFKKSQVGDKTQLHIAPATAPTHPLPAPVAKTHISTAFDAAEKVKTALDSGNGLYVFPFPLVTFRKQGGAPFVVSGKIVGVAGDSGTGKTTFLATIIDGLLAQGVYVYHDSPEWSPEELYILDIQAESGGRLTYHRIEGHINALQSEALGLAIPEDVPGRLSGDELALFDTLSAQILERNLRPERGQVRYVDTSLSLEHKLQVIQASITEDRANGLQRHAVVFDYLQALKMEHEPKKGKNYEQEKLTTIKSWCDPAAANVAVFLATQVVKEQSTRMRETGRRMGADAMHSINRNEFNYLLNMNIVYQKSEDGTLLTEKGEKQRVTCNIGTYEKPVDVPLMLAEVQKNNRGPEGALIPMLLNWQTARFEAVDVAGDGLPLAGSRRGL